MRTEHFKLFLVLRITPKSRAKVCAQWRILKHPGSLLASDRSRGGGFGVIRTECFWSRCFVS